MSDQKVCGLICSGVLILLGLVLWAGCREAEIFEQLSDEVTHPSAITHDGQYFYVVNADLERRYNAGSILTISLNGSKEGLLITPRLGRFIVHRDAVLIVGHSTTNQYLDPPAVRFYDASKPEKLRLIASKDLECSPINAVAPEGYPYFVISCMNGQIYVGRWSRDPLKKAPELYLVRDYGPHARRALYIDTEEHVLYAFATDWQRPQFRDLVLEDLYDYSAASVVERGNDVPDRWEDPESLAEQSLNTEERYEIMSEYQVAVYSFVQGKKTQFSYSDRYSTQVNQELRWLHFAARGPEVGVKLKSGEKYYRSNFWQAHQDPEDPRSFILSQRGYQDTEEDLNLHTNALYRFTLTDSPYTDTGRLRQLSSFITVSHFWGHGASDSVSSSYLNSNLSQKSDLKNQDLRFTGHFALSSAYKSPYVLVGDFRDTSLFPNAAYSLSLKRLYGTTGFDDFYHLSRERSHSFFALSALGTRILTGSFYTNVLSLFKITKDFKLLPYKEIR